MYHTPMNIHFSCKIFYFLTSEIDFFEQRNLDFQNLSFSPQEYLYHYSFSKVRVPDRHLVMRRGNIPIVYAQSGGGYDYVDVSPINFNQFDPTTSQCKRKTQVFWTPSRA